MRSCRQRRSIDQAQRAGGSRNSAPTQSFLIEPSEHPDTHARMHARMHARCRWHPAIAELRARMHACSARQHQASPLLIENSRALLHCHAFAARPRPPATRQKSASASSCGHLLFASATWRIAAVLAPELLLVGDGLRLLLRVERSDLPAAMSAAAARQRAAAATSSAFRVRAFRAAAIDAPRLLLPLVLRGTSRRSLRKRAARLVPADGAGDELAV